MSIITSVETITPERAALYMELSGGNRPLNERRVAEYAKAMVAGQWMTNGESIIISDTGRLINGRHRLTAVLKSGASIKTVVVRGVADDTFPTIDTPYKRNPSQVLAIAKKKNYVALSVAMRVYLAIKSDDPLVAFKRNPSLECRTILSTVDAHPNVELSVEKAQALGFGHRTAIVSQGVAAGMHAAFAEVHADVARVFMTQLSTGEQLHKSDPVYLLRERLIQNSTAQARLSTSMIVALAVQAFNATVRGESPKFLRVMPGESRNFPKLVKGDYMRLVLAR